MRWVVFAVAAVLGLVFDTGLSEVLRIEKLGDIRPSLCAVVAVFVALSAPRTAALWACLVLGVLLDLAQPLTVAENRVVYLIGPYALGYLFGGWLVIAGRSMVFRRRPLTIGVMTVLLLLAVQIVAVTVYLVRAQSWYPGQPIVWTDVSVPAELGRRLLAALYSGVFAVPVGWLLVQSMGLWGFQTVVHRPQTIR
jgi:cell shape-determining protein MreD